MLKHFITKYQANGRSYASSWIQLRLFGKVFCFSRKVIEMKEETPKSIDILFRPRSQMRG